MAVNDIKVSVVIAAYNSEKYLRQTMDSILAQTLQEIEVICVDDGSDDGTLNILREYGQLDDRVSVYRHTEQTDGAAEARNLGLMHARGEYLSVLDADDFFETDMLEKSYEKAIETGADIVLYDGWVFDEGIQTDKESDFILRKEYLPETDTFSPEENADQLFLMMCGAAWSGIYRRTFIEENDIRFQSFHHADDLGFAYLALACAKRITLLREKMIHYRKNSGTSQADLVHLWPETCYLALDQLKDALDSRELFQRYHIAFAQIVMVYAIFYLDGMREWKDFAYLHGQLREKWLERFGVYDVPKESFKNPYWATYRGLMREASAGEEMFRRVRGQKPFQRPPQWSLPPLEGKRVAVYGAGKYGRQLFCRLIVEKKSQVVTWVDKNYASIGYPVQAPETLAGADMDIVVVAIASPHLFQEVKGYLMARGIEASRICWIKGER